MALSIAVTMLEWMQTRPLCSHLFSSCVYLPYTTMHYVEFWAGIAFFQEISAVKNFGAHKIYSDFRQIFQRSHIKKSETHPLFFLTSFYELNASAVPTSRCLEKSRNLFSASVLDERTNIVLARKMRLKRRHYEAAVRQPLWKLIKTTSVHQQRY
jgi:hypothetical protein